MSSKTSWQIVGRVSDGNWAADFHGFRGWCEKLESGLRNSALGLGHISQISHGNRLLATQTSGKMTRHTRCSTEATMSDLHIQIRSIA